MIEQILMEINDTVQLRVGGKLIKFRGHEGITENHESFYPQNFPAVRYINIYTYIHTYIHTYIYIYIYIHTYIYIYH